MLRRLADAAARGDSETAGMKTLLSARSVWFDVGETLLDETRAWGLWADALEVPRFTFFALLGAVIGRGGHHREVFGFFPPDQVARAQRTVAGEDRPRAEDLYPDALACLSALSARGFRVGLAGNQTSAAEEALRGLGWPVDHVASSAAWGAQKPSAAFFARLLQESGCPARQIVYVGDRLDNDVLPARAAGLKAVLLRRGPWGMLHARQRDAGQAHLVLNGLSELPGQLDLA